MNSLLQVTKLRISLHVKSSESSIYFNIIYIISIGNIFNIFFIIVKIIDNYFKWCDEQREITENGIVCKPYTISGLCLFLDICYDTLSEYEKLIVQLKMKKNEEKVEQKLIKKQQKQNLNFRNCKKAVRIN